MRTRQLIFYCLTLIVSMRSTHQPSDHRLLPELYAHLNPMPFEAAAQVEIDLADDLRRAGYTVTGGH